MPVFGNRPVTLMLLLIAVGVAHYAPPIAAAAPTGDVLQRIGQLIADCDAAQFKAVDQLPDDRSFTLGQYPALIDFKTGEPPDLQPLIEDITDASGSTIIGLWFLSQSHCILEQIDSLDTTPQRAAIRTQLQRAAAIPRFFQGDSQDVWDCPPDTMGWYPLIDGYRIPSLLPDTFEQQASPDVLRDLANLSDGDIWAWCMAIDDTTPDILQYRLPITDPGVYAPLLGSHQTWQTLDPHAREVYRQVRGFSLPTRYPIGTFYGTSTEYPQRYSCVVMANILASIPLLGEPAEDDRQHIDNAVAFVREATALALDGDLAWEDFAYDYFTIPIAPIAFVARAHKRIEEIGQPGFPTLLDAATLDAAEAFIAHEAEILLDEPALDAPEGAADYASLVYAFSAMMNLRAVDPARFDRDLVDRAAAALLAPNTDAYAVPGTGPYQLAGPIYADMASICFIAPPLVEAYALYLKEQSQRTAADRAWMRPRFNPPETTVRTSHRTGSPR